MMLRFSMGLLLVSVALRARAGMVDALVLDYLEWEPEGRPYAARVIITPGFMRQDFGPDDRDFVLLDRSAGVIYSVQSDDQRILEVAASGPAPVAPDGIELDQRSRQEPGAPLVGGQAPVFTDYLSADRLCYQTVSVPGLLPDAVAAWSQFRQLMAAQQAATAHHTPVELQDPCQLANDVYAPLRHLQQGLPIREQNPAGLSRELRGYRPAQAVDEALFQLPHDYRRFAIEPAGG